MLRSSAKVHQPYMMRKLYSAAALAATLIALPAQAGDKNWPELGVESKIAFANHGGIRDFRPDGDYGLWIQDNKKRWHYAALSSRCNGLGFSNAVAFETGGLGSFDRFGYINVDGQRCDVSSLVTAEKPISGKALKQLQDDVRAAARKAVATS